MAAGSWYSVVSSRYSAGMLFGQAERTAAWVSAPSRGTRAGLGKRGTDYPTLARASVGS